MLANYRKIDVPEYLDGRYFEKVMKTFDPWCVSRSPLIIRLIGDLVYTNEEPFLTTFEPLRPIIYTRIIIEKLEDGVVVSRHSNLLILSINNDTAYHYEPDISYISANKQISLEVAAVIERVSEALNLTIMSRKIASTIKERACTKKLVGGYCVAYVLKTAYFFELDKREGNDSLEDIRKFSRTVEALYGPLPEGEPDVEFGPGTNKVVGGLVGAGLGYALLGPAGGLLGGAGGVYAGSKVGDKRDTTRK